jgi:rRNA maturation endonuclease Nob1
MKDCPDCWHEVTYIEATECESCGCKFVELIANDTEWEEITE